MCISPSSSYAVVNASLARRAVRPGWDVSVEGGDLPQATKDFIESLDGDGREDDEGKRNDADIWSDARESR